MRKNCDTFAARKELGKVDVGGSHLLFEGRISTASTACTVRQAHEFTMRSGKRTECCKLEAAEYTFQRIIPALAVSSPRLAVTGKALAAWPSGICTRVKERMPNPKGRCVVLGQKLTAPNNHKLVLGIHYGWRDDKESVCDTSARSQAPRSMLSKN